jgi:hypothetical protein
MTRVTLTEAESLFLDYCLKIDLDNKFIDLFDCPISYLEIIRGTHLNNWGMFFEMMGNWAIKNNIIIEV